MIGIIIPPGDIKKLVEKTAEHVANNGSQFENMILQRQQHKTQFAFLNKDNPYRAYYDHMVGEFSRKLIQSANQQKEEVQEVKMEIKKQEVISPKQQEQFLERIFEQLDEPDKQKYTAELPQKLTEAEMAIIQHTAQYSARNGKNFLVALSEREKNNPQFQFLKSSSNNYKYFMALNEAYSAILSLTPKDIDNIIKQTESHDKIMQKCTKIYEYHMAKTQQAKDKKQQNQPKKQHMIDWNDFELVDTIMFQDTLSNNSRIEEGLRQFRVQHNLNASRNMEEKIINEPKKRQILQQCKSCNRKILVTEMNAHLKTCLRIKTNQNKIQQQQQGSNVDIYQQLNELKVDPSSVKPQNNQEKLIWDGQAPNITRTTATIAMNANQQKKIKEQIYNNLKK